MADNDNLILFDGSDESLHEDLASFYTKKDLPPTKTTSDVDADDDTDDDTSLEDGRIKDSGEDQDKTQNSEKNKEDENVDPESLEAKYNTLIELGYLELPEDYKTPTTEEELEKAVNDSKVYRQEQAVAAIWESLPEEGKPLLEYLLNGGKDIESFQKVHSQFPNLETIDLNDVEAQKQVMKMFYTKKGFTEAKANKQVEILENLMELETEAKDALTELKQIDKQEKENLIKQAKEHTAKKEEAENKRWQILQQTLNTTEDFGGGYTIGKKAKPTALQSLYKQVRTEDGTVTTDFNYKLRNVVLQDPKLTLVLSDMLNRLTQDKKTGEIYFDFSHIQERAETKVTKGFSEKLDRLADAGNKFKSGNIVTKSGGFDWESVL